jgi:hypothetical protein
VSSRRRNVTPQDDGSGDVTGWGWWRHRGNPRGMLDAKRRLRDAYKLAGSLAERREENGFGAEIDSVFGLWRGR